MVMRLLIVAASAEEHTAWSAALGACGLPIALLVAPKANAALFPLAEVNVPDILLVNAGVLPVDIMPQILQCWKQTSHVLLVTENTDFDFAVTAFRNGVYDLLRQPLDPLRLRQDLQDILTHRSRFSMDDLSFEQRRIVGKQLISYARRVHPDQQLDEREVNSLYRTQFRKGAFRFLTICFDSRNPSFPADPDKFLSLAQAAVLNAVGTMCYEMFLNCDYLRYHVMLNYAPEDDPKLLTLLRQALDNSQSLLAPDEALTFCCSQAHGSIFDIIPLMDESGDAIWERLQNKTGKLLIGAAPAPCPKELQQILDSAQQRLKGACTTLDIEQFRRELELLYSLPKPWKSRHEMRGVLRGTEHYMFQVNRDLIASFTDTEQVRWNLILQLRRVTTVDKYIQVYTEQMTILFQQILDHSVGQKSRPVRQAQQFIRQNYASALDLETVARNAGLSPVYFSAIFKKEMGIGFSDYLNQCRIEQAKRLLESTGWKILAVSKAVGFSSPRYFSRVFQNLVGIRPSEYRIAAQRSGHAEASSDTTL